MIGTLDKPNSFAHQNLIDISSEAFFQKILRRSSSTHFEKPISSRKIEVFRIRTKSLIELQSTAKSDICSADKETLKLLIKLNEQRKTPCHIKKLTPLELGKSLMKGFVSSAVLVLLILGELFPDPTIIFLDFKSRTSCEYITF